MLPHRPSRSVNCENVGMVVWRRNREKNNIAAGSAASFCIEALQEALARFGQPEVFNSDQGSQLTSLEFTDALQRAGVRVPIAGRGALDGQRGHRAAVAQPEA